jgi:glucosyl-dolichyl phosphate glucuronosyltransferase
MPALVLRMPVPHESVTVAICTWNRHALLRQTLEQMTRLVVPAGATWELLVVNNNCTDATDEVVASFADRLPIRRLFESRPGQSNARNLAIREAAGRYIIWTDDDVLVAEDWLVEYFRAFARWPEASVFAGLIEPWFPSPPPVWLERAWSHVAHAYATVDYGKEPLPLTQKRVPFGANMAMRTDSQRAHLYDPDLGLRPGSQMRGDETDVVRRALADGASGWWVPSARVRHYIPPERQTLAYLRAWYGGYGEYLARFDEDRMTSSILGRPRWLWRQVVVAELRHQIQRRTQPPERWVPSLTEAATARGQFRAYPLLRRGAAPEAVGDAPTRATTATG